MDIEWGSIDGISLVVSVLAFLLAAYATIQSSRLARRQIQQFDEEQAERAKADVRVRLVEYDFRKYRFEVMNVGQGAARDVHFVVDDGTKSPLISSEHREKFPVESIPSGEMVALIASLSMGMGTTFPCSWGWRNEDGTAEDRRQKVSLT